ncbi:MAG TPA: 50S ribosomal protein L31 [Coriobacteriia bacterium]|jgi:large subunit ribosomal protein L31
MRNDIHPDYVEAKVTCSCGNTFTTRSTKNELHVELCNKCHPFYTGQQKFVDTGGRVQRFADKFGNAADRVAQKQAAEKEARQKAAEEAAEAARAARSQRDGRKAEKSARHEVEQATKAGETDAAGDAAPEAEGEGGEE